MNSAPILPPAIRIGRGADFAARPVVRVDLALAGESQALAIVASPAAARMAAAFLIGQDDRRVRALGALLLRQADLVEGRSSPPGLRLVEGGR